MSAKFYGDISLLRKISEDVDILAVKYTRSGTKLFTGSADGLVRYYSSGTFQLIGKVGIELTDPQIERHPVTCIESFPSLTTVKDYWCLATSTDGTIKLWNMHKQRLLATITEDQQIYGIHNYPFANKFVSYGDDTMIKLYDQETMRLCQTFGSTNVVGKIDGHTSRIFSVNFHPRHHNEFVSGGWDNTLQFWDLRSPAAVRYIAGPHICGDSIRFRPNGKEILTGSYTKDWPLQLFDYRSGRLIANLEVDSFSNAMVYCVSWLDDTYFTVGSTEPSIFRVVSMTDLSSIAYYRSQFTAVYSLDIISTTHAETRQSSNASKGKEVSEQSSFTKTEPNINMPKETDIDVDIPYLRGIFCNGRILLEVEVKIPK